MLNLAEYRQRPALLADWLPWAGLVAPGVVLNKDGSFQRTARFRGPDLDSATQGELIATSARLNNALRRMGSGWALFIEAERRPAADYPHSEFPEPLSWLLILDEAWLFLDDPAFAARIRQWLKTLRKKNVSVIFATQSLADIKDSSIAPAIIESCASRIFLPNPQATEPQIRTIYEGFGLNKRQIEIVATAQPKRDYYYQSRLGNRLFDLDLGPAALAFAGASTPQDQRDIDRVLLDAGVPGFAGAWLRHRGLDWAADLLPSFPGLAPGSLRTADHS